MKVIAGTKVVLRYEGKTDQIRSGARLRILEGRAVPLDEAVGSWVVSATAATETFLLGEAGT